MRALESMEELFQERLKSIYEERELESMWRLYSEDVIEGRKETFSDEVFEKDLKELQDFRPIQYVIGQADFYGYRFKVDERVLVPRPETEELVYWVMNDLSEVNSDLRVLEVGTGSGCILGSLAKKYSKHQYLAIDVSLDALQIAQENFESLDVEVATRQVDFLDSANWASLGEVDLIVCNPPYIDLNDTHILSKQVVKYEPHVALFAGSDPIIFYKKINEFALNYLSEFGHIYVELNEFYKAEIMKVFQANFDSVICKSDMQGQFRMLKISRS